jgi:glycosyltransferase involved in cell wall biosynthesis
METGMNKTSVMHVVTRLNIGGVAVHVLQLAADLDPASYYSQVVSGLAEPNETDMMYLADELGVKPIFISSLRRSISLMDDCKAVTALYKTMRNMRPDVVITHTSKAGTLGRIAAVLARVPIIIHTYHGNIFNGYYGKAKTQVFICVERILALFSNFLIALSQQQKRELEKHHIAPSDKIAIVPLGFDFSSVIPAPDTPATLREEFHIPTEVPVIGIIGRLATIKNHKLFLKIAHLVVEQNSDVHFLIVGDGELREELEQAVDHFRIHFAGFRTDLPMVYTSLDAVMLTSINEGTPVALIEAMACGKVVFSTKVGGVEDFVTHGINGFYFDPADVDGYAKQILHWLANPGEYEEISENARKTALKEFSISTLLANMESLLANAKRKRIK